MLETAGIEFKKLHLCLFSHDKYKGDDWVRRVGVALGALGVPICYFPFVHS